MAEIAVAQAAFAGFGLLRRKPWAPVVWSLIYVGVLSGLIVLLGGAFIIALGKLMRASADHATPKPEEILGLLGGVLGGYVLLLFVFWILGAIVNMAVVRAVLAPEAGAFAYLRLGAAELWLLLANFILGIIYAVASTALAIPASLAMVALILYWHEAAPFVGLPIQMVTWTVTIWLGLRFCMVPSLIFSDRQFRLFESWTLTRGHAWRLFQVGFLAMAVSVLIYLLLVGVGLAAGFPLISQLANSMTPQAFFSQTPAQVLSATTPVLALYVGLIGVGSAVLFPVFLAPWAEAYRQLKGGEIDATFS